jgi:hypothetical protein
MIIYGIPPQIKKIVVKADGRVLGLKEILEKSYNNEWVIVEQEVPLIKLEELDD